MNITLFPETRGGMVGSDWRPENKQPHLHQTPDFAAESQGQTGLCGPPRGQAYLHVVLHEWCIHGVRSGVQVPRGCARGWQWQWQWLDVYRHICAHILSVHLFVYIICLYKTPTVIMTVISALLVQFVCTWAQVYNTSVYTNKVVYTLTYRPYCTLMYMCVLEDYRISIHNSCILCND